MALLSDVLFFKSVYDYSSPRFGWAELILLPVTYCYAYTINVRSDACVLITAALAAF